ncbi:MAG: MurR/RpiR family transcriptional regulator [Synergistaceae bacterium]|nr:MurR/RpiR family transcriptional regulator [Synergistaceae bacterium]
MNPIERIRAIYASFSKKQRRIADLLLRRENSVCFMSLKDLSMEASVTAVTIMNFVKKLGYQNFSEFKREYQSYIQSMISPRSVVREDSPYCEGKITPEAIERIRRSERQLLEESYAMIHDDHLISAVALIKQARTIYLVAKNLSEPVAATFQKRLAFLGLDSELLSLENLNILPRMLARANELDVFVVFSFPNYSQSIIDVGRCARQRGCTIICITDKSTSPMACYSDIVLLCQTASLVFYNSMTAPLSIINILATLLAMELKEKLDENRETYQALASFFDHSVVP